jgi:DNA-binding SARP family transcriptional activator
MAADMQFCLLGPLVVRSGGTAVPLPQGKQRAVLASLLLNAGRVVSVDQLSAVLWGPVPPQSAPVTVRNYVKRLRHALGDAGHCRISTHPGGYLMTADADELDVARFDVLLSSARGASRAGQYADAAAQLREALSLWRGEPLQDVPSDLLTIQEVPRLAEMRLQALEARIHADLHLGRHAETIIELRRETAANPLRDGLHALLMLALYRDGQPAAALAAYQAARRVLVGEVGIEPGPELRRLQRQILSADPALATGSSPLRATATGNSPPQATATSNSPPRATATGDSAPRATATGSSALRPGAPPRAQHGALVPRQLPSKPAHFAGRPAELALLAGMLDEAASQETVAIAAICGTAGVGKTALAVHWAHRVADRFPDGQLFIDLQGFGPADEPVTAAEAIRRLLDGLGVTAERIPVDLGAQAGLYRSLLAGKRTLIVLDNARDPGQVRPLLPGSAGCLVLVTSRSQVTGLAAADDASLLALDVLSEREARELLQARLGEERLAREPAAVTKLIGLCARLPLALSVAAARAAARPELSIAALAAGLADVQTRLDGLDTGDAATDVRSVLSWSCRQLSRPAARMFRLLGVHPGPDITAEAAASLAGVSRATARQALAELDRACLITEQGSGRFAFHDLLRAYATEQAHRRERSTARRAAMHRVLDHYLHSADSASRTLNPYREVVMLSPRHPGVTPEAPAGRQPALAWFQAERLVLLASIRQAADDGFGAHAWQLPWAMAPFLSGCGLYGDLKATQQTALLVARSIGDRAGQAHAHHFLGQVNCQLGAHAEAVAELTAALRAGRQLGSIAIQAREHSTLSAAHVRQGRTAEALSHARQALRLSRTSGHAFGQAHSLNAIGWCHTQLGDYQAALDTCGQALALYRDLGYLQGEAAALDSLGYARYHLGCYSAAVECYQQAINVLSDSGDRDDQAEFLTHLGDAHQASGDHDAARRAWQEALDILDSLQAPSAEPLRARLNGQPAVGTPRRPGGRARPEAS